MANSRICVVVLLLFLAFSLAPQGQVLAIQSSSSVLLVETVEWQPSSANLVLNGESNSRNRLLWTLIGAGAGGGLAYLWPGLSIHLAITTTGLRLHWAERYSGRLQASF